MRIVWRFQSQIQRRNREMGGRNSAGKVLSKMLEPSRPQPVGRVEQSFVLTCDARGALLRHAAQYGVDERLEMHGPGIGLRKPVARVDRGMRRDLQKQK